MGSYCNLYFYHEPLGKAQVKGDLIKITPWIPEKQ